MFVLALTDLAGGAEPWARRAVRRSIGGGARADAEKLGYRG